MSIEGYSEEDLTEVIKLCTQDLVDELFDSNIPFTYYGDYMIELHGLRINMSSVIKGIHQVIGA